MSGFLDRPPHALRVSAGAAIANLAILFAGVIYFENLGGILLVPLAMGPLYCVLLVIGIVAGLVAVRARYAWARIWLSVNIGTAIPGAAILFIFYPR